MTTVTPVPDTPEERQKWLKIPENRASVLNFGAGMLFYFGDPENPEVIISHRDPKVGEGLALFGGLREHTDNVPDDPVQSAKNNATREAREELAEILNSEPDFDTSTLTPLFARKDDAYFIRNGYGHAVDAIMHACEAQAPLIETLFPDGITTRDRHPDYEGEEETLKIEKTTLFEALKRQDEFHYPVEYAAVWATAIKILGFERDTLVQKIDEAVDFGRLAEKLDISRAQLDEVIGVK